ncbi:MAG: hypothetical protein IT440_13740 [Phycisphaeraceae bacterium]|nr:hypothetical protein [Phycisphaeraceae bacterium]
MKQTLKGAVVALGAVAGLTAGTAAAADEAGTFSVRHQGIAHDALYDICFNDSLGFAVGVAGTVLFTEDQGVSWRSLASPGAEAILGLDCASANILAVGQGGVILRRDGENWNKVESGTDARLLDVSANETGLAVAVGGFGTVLKSEDGGRSWEPLSFDWEALLNDFVEPHIYDVHVSAEGEVTVVGEFGLVLHSVDGGETWNMTHRGEASLFALEIDGNVGYAVGQHGAILRTEDGAQTWRDLASGTDANLLDVLTDRDGVVHVTGIRTLLESADGGNTWESRRPGDISSRWYQSLGMSKAGVFMVGHSGRIVQIK